MSSLAAIGTGLFLSKKGKASRGEFLGTINCKNIYGRQLVTTYWAWEQYKKGNMKRRWISKEYLYDSTYDLEIVKGFLPMPWPVNKTKRDLMIFVDMKDGGKYMYRENPLTLKRQNYSTFHANTIPRNFS
jgi:hypothetical protein